MASNAQICVYVTKRLKIKVDEHCEKNLKEYGEKISFSGACKKGLKLLLDSYLPPDLQDELDAYCRRNLSKSGLRMSNEEAITKAVRALIESEK